MKNFFQKEIFCDVHLKTKNGIIKCHREVIQSKCSLFENIKIDNFIEVYEFNFENHEFQILKEVIKSFYGFPISENNLCNPLYQVYLRDLDYSNNYIDSSKENSLGKTASNIEIESISNQNEISKSKDLIDNDNFEIIDHEENEIESYHSDSYEEYEYEEDIFIEEEGAVDSLKKRYYPKYKNIRKAIFKKENITLISKEKNEIDLDKKFENLSDLHIFIQTYSLNIKKKYFIHYSSNSSIQYKCRNCKASIMAKINIHGKWFFSNVINHSCEQNIYFVSSKIIENEIKSFGILFKNKNDIIKLIKKKYPNVKAQRILRIYNNIWNLESSNLFVHWNMILEIVNRIFEIGGKKIIDYNKKNQITFIGFITPLATLYIKSNCFFGTIIADSTFITSSSKGNLLSIIVKLPNKTIFPIITGWTSRETKSSWLKMFSILESLNISVKALVSDQGISMIQAFKEKFKFSLYCPCIWHLSFKVPLKSRSIFWNLLNVKSPTDFLEKWNDFKNNTKIEFFEKINKYKHQINIFSENFRQKIYASSLIESLHSTIKSMKNNEIDDIFKHIVFLQYNNLHKIIVENSFRIFIKEIEEEIEIYHEYISNYQIINYTGTEIFEVFFYKDNIKNIFQVNLSSNSCSCNKLINEGIPCIHIFSCYLFRNKQEKDFNLLVHDCYKYSQFKKLLDLSSHVPDFSDLSQKKEKKVILELFNKRKRRKKRYLISGFK